MRYLPLPRPADNYDYIRFVNVIVSLGREEDRAPIVRTKGEIIGWRTEQPSAEKRYPLFKDSFP